MNKKHKHKPVRRLMPMSGGGFEMVCAKAVRRESAENPSQAERIAIDLAGHHSLTRNPTDCYRCRWVAAWSRAERAVIDLSGHHNCTTLPQAARKQPCQPWLRHRVATQGGMLAPPSIQTPPMPRVSFFQKQQSEGERHHNTSSSC